MQPLQTTTNANALSARISALINANRPAAARHLLAAVRRLVPPSPATTALSARIALSEGDFPLALSELDEAVAQFPDDASLRKCRAEARLRSNDATGALADAAEAVFLDRSDPAAKAMLGVVLLEHGRAGDALVCLDEAVAAQPANPAFRRALAVAQEASGDQDAALTTLRAAIAAAPCWAEPRNGAILVYSRRHDFTAACRLAEEARLAGAADACTFGLLGHALSSLGRHAEAGEAYAEALKLGPDDPYVRHMVAAAGIRPSAPRAPVEYVRTVFDGYAERFEAHLIWLGYRVPGLIRAILTRHLAIMRGDRLAPALDLGCGTGLVAVVLSDMQVGPLTGVDVSPRMLQVAAEKQLYDSLIEADLTAFLAEDTRCWRLIVAGDVLPYFGALGELFSAVYRRLEPGGWFVFSVEELPPDRATGGEGWALQRLARYAHSMDYVTTCAAAAGLRVITMDRQTLRYEADAPVAGVVSVLERPADEC